MNGFSLTEYMYPPTCLVITDLDDFLRRPLTEDVHVALAQRPRDHAHALVGVGEGELANYPHLKTARLQQETI